MKSYFINSSSFHGKNGSVEVSENLAKYKLNLRIILLDHQNNYIERLNVDDKVVKS